MDLKSTVPATKFSDEQKRDPSQQLTHRPDQATNLENLFTRYKATSVLILTRSDPVVGLISGSVFLGQSET